MRTSRVRSFERWRMIAASIIAIDVAAILWVVVARSVGFDPIGGGPLDGYGWYFRMSDGSFNVISYDYSTNKTIGRTVIFPAPPGGSYRVWWPAFAAVPLTLLGLALASTRGGRRIFTRLPVPQITTLRLMTAVAILGADLGWVLRTMESPWACLLSDGGPLVFVDLVSVHALAFMGFGVALLFNLGRRRPSPNDPETVTSRV